MRKIWWRTPDPGLGEKYSRPTKRLINKNGTFNIKKRGKELRLYDLYQHLSSISVTQLSLYVIGFYLLINIFFAWLYILCGVEKLYGIDPKFSPFLNAFFFSVQTFTTVGYGVMSPHGLAANLVVTVESLMGWVGFAIITGVVYGRFSKPNVRILYSNNALITPTEEGNILQFRLANKRNNILMEIEAKVLVMVQDANFERHYYNLKLEQSSQHFFPLSWTIVHHIDEDSPLYNMTPEQLAKQRAEILILIRGYDDNFGHDIHSRFSYCHDEISWNSQFKNCYFTDKHGETILDLPRLHDIEPVAEKTTA